MTLCFATNNHHKIEEVMGVLGGAFRILTLNDIGCHEELEEAQDTLEGNAYQKASYVWTHYQTPCFADDTGLEVESLNGEPGVISARYAGPGRNSEDNMDLLLSRMADRSNRNAQFRTVISLILPHGEWLFEGIVKGEILSHRRGSGGFGYDPVFLPDGSTKTLAEMTLEEKNAISHRARAMKKLVDFLSSQ